MNTINEAILSNNIENKTQFFIEFSDAKREMFNLYHQDAFYIERFEEEELSNVIISDDDKEVNYSTKIVSKRIASKITENRYNEILSLDEISERKFNTDELVLKSDLTLQQFLLKFFYKS